MCSSNQTKFAPATVSGTPGALIASDIGALSALLSSVARLEVDPVLLRLAGIGADWVERLQTGAVENDVLRLDWCDLAEEGCVEVGALFAAIERLSGDATVKVLAGMGKHAAQDLDNEVDLFSESLRVAKSGADQAHALMAGTRSRQADRVATKTLASAAA